MVSKKINSLWVSGIRLQSSMPLSSELARTRVLVSVIFSVTQLLCKFLFHLESILFFLYQQAASFILHQEVYLERYNLTAMVDYYDPLMCQCLQDTSELLSTLFWQSVAYGHSALGISFNILMWPFLSILRFILFSINCVCMCVRAHVCMCSPMETGDIGFFWSWDSSVRCLMCGRNGIRGSERAAHTNH